MQDVVSLGAVEWNQQDIRDAIPEFLQVYEDRPLLSNEGGMRSPHMFAVWFMLRRLEPKSVVESGIWWGQGTWLIETAVPSARVYSIDTRLDRRRYTSDKVKYFDVDFTMIDWSQIEDKESALLFFDDHQNAVERLKQGIARGFRHFIFEDNYPAGQGDCYSLKKAFQHAGFTFRPPTGRRRTAKEVVQHMLKRARRDNIAPNSTDAQYLTDVLETYHEFPPVLRGEKTRWGDDWDGGRYPTPKALFDHLDRDDLRLFDEESVHYTWICYAKARRGSLPAL